LLKLWILLRCHGVEALRGLEHLQPFEAEGLEHL
jgi:hypothetical protein